MIGSCGAIKRGAACTLFLLLLAAPAPAQESPPEGRAAQVIAAVRVHGNHTTADAVILSLSGVVIGQPFTDAVLAGASSRLKASGRFRDVEIRKRYLSLTDPGQIVLIILVEERAAVSIDQPSPGPLHRLGSSMMWLPMLDYEDGYGFTYGARLSFVDLLGARTRLSTPLTWGGERRAAVEVERTFERGPFSRVIAAGSIRRRENPAYDSGDRRTELTLRAERALTPVFRVGTGFTAADVAFRDIDDRIRSAFVDAIFDTRRNPAFPRNAFYAALGWERLWFDTAPDTYRTRADLRGYVGLIGQTVLVVRGEHSWAADPLPAFEDALLGGALLRGFRAGYRADDQRALGTLEIRLPLSSPLKLRQLGVAVFSDAGSTYPAGSPLRLARFDASVGAGIFAGATVFNARLDVARRVGGGTRVIFGFGLAF